MRRIFQARMRRHISADWLNGADALVTQLAAASTLQRARIIRKSSTVWSELREALWRAGGEKCWYSEVLLPIGQAEVEHFRPKGRLSKEQHAGYWWLAFDWRNYRIASHLANVRKFDLLNRSNRGKGGYFPLVGGVRAVYLQNPPVADPLCINCERPLLLDPVDANDVRLLSFDQDGRATANSVTCTNEESKQRVTQSVFYYHLDDGILVARRADRWKQVLEWSEEVETLCAATDLGQLSETQQARLQQLFNQVADCIDKAAEFSAVAIAALTVRGDRGWNTQLIAAAA